MWKTGRYLEGSHHTNKIETYEKGERTQLGVEWELEHSSGSWWFLYERLWAAGYYHWGNKEVLWALAEIPIYIFNFKNKILKGRFYLIAHTEWIKWYL